MRNYIPGFVNRRRIGKVCDSSENIMQEGEILVEGIDKE